MNADHNWGQLAINGGSKTIAMDLPSRGHFGVEEKSAALALFDSCIAAGSPFGYNGSEEEAFCAEFAEFFGGGYADGVNSGTTAVHVALAALEPEPFSEVIVGPYTDPGGIMPIVIQNCIPVIADAIPSSFNTGPEQVEARITPRTSAIIIPHIGGEPADIAGIMSVARKHSLPVIEDCAQSHAAKLDGKYVGTFGDVAAFSLMFGKHSCTGGQGGMVFTKNPEIYKKVRRYADRGKPFGLDGANGNVVPSLNFNMDELHAAIGRVQLRKLPDIVARRRRFVELLKQAGLDRLSAVGVPELPSGVEHSYWWWRLRFQPNKVGCSKNEFLDAVASEGVLLIKDYRIALPFKYDWFKNRADKHPWNNPCCQDDPTRDFLVPNAEAAVEEFFILRLFESWGEIEAEAIVSAFRKVELAFLK